MLHTEIMQAGHGDLFEKKVVIIMTMLCSHTLWAPNMGLFDQSSSAHESW